MTGDGGKMASPQSEQEPASSSGQRRAFKACLNCRERKAKCDVGDTNDPQIPCARCKREGRECVFVPHSNLGKRRRGSDQINTPGNSQVIRQLVERYQCRPNPYNNIHSSYSPTLSSSTKSSPTVDPHASRDRLIYTSVRNAEEALQVLADGSVALSQGTAKNPAQQPIHAEPSQPPPDWSRFQPVARGLVTVEEVMEYIDFFYDKLRAFYVIVPWRWQSRAHMYELINQEPIVLTSLLTVATRYHKLQTFGGASRSERLHDKLWRWTESQLQKSLWSYPRAQNTLGIIESLLLFCEWTPKSLDLTDQYDSSNDMFVDFKPSEDYAERLTESTSNTFIKETIASTIRTDRMAWVMVGNAISLAIEIGLFADQDTEALSSGHSADQFISQSESFLLRRRNRSRIACYIAHENVAARIGKTSMLSSSVTGPVSNRRDDSADQPVINILLRLTQLRSMAREMLYGLSLSRDGREDSPLLGSRRHIPILSHFYPLVEDTRDEITRIQDMPECCAAMVWIEFYFLQIYIYSYVLEATIDKNGSSPNYASLFQSENNRFLNEAIDAALAMLRIVEQLGIKGNLVYAPVKCFLRINATTSFLIKALHVGNLVPDPLHCIGVLENTVKLLQSNCPDDVHLSARWAQVLSDSIAPIKEKYLLAQVSHDEYDSEKAGQVNSSAEHVSVDVGLDWLSALQGPSNLLFSLEGNCLTDNIGHWKTMYGEGVKTPAHKG